MSIFGKIIGTFSGVQNTIGHQLLFDKVIGFRSVIHGAGATTCVYNIAAALSDKTTYNVCVLDTHMLQPALQTFLVTQELPARDWFDYSGNLSEVVCDTKLRGVKYIGFYQRTLNDMLSTRDCRALVDNLIAVLKNVFDIVLVDLSDEHTNASAYTAIQCNRIYSIVTPELACQSGFVASINTAVTQAVPAYKLRTCIMNKAVGSTIDSKMTKLLSDTGFNLLTQIPYSPELHKINLLGERIWGAATTNADVTKANTALSVILQDLLEVTDKNQGKLIDKTLTENVIETPQGTIAQTVDMGDAGTIILEDAYVDVENNTQQQVTTQNVQNRTVLGLQTQDVQPQRKPLVRKTIQRNTQQ